MTTPALCPPPGRSALPFADSVFGAHAIMLQCYRPKHVEKIVFVQHGMMRNGDEYRDFWIDAADKHNLLIVAPTFGNTEFPKPENYNNGMVVQPDGMITPRYNWLYAVPQRIFAALEGGGFKQKTAYLFGHSAGAQFNHRLLATGFGGYFSHVIAANAGWYTLPSFDHRFPEGLGGLPLGENALAEWLQRPMVLLAGDRDIATDDPNLPSGPEPLAQGPHRFARAHFMFEAGKAAAARLKVPFGWKLHVVEGIGHDGAAMSRAAAAFWFEGHIPHGALLQPSQGASL